MKYVSMAVSAAALLYGSLGSLALADEPPAEPNIKWEVGTRVWYSTAMSEFDLFDGFGGTVSALHYEQDAATAEIYGRADLPQHRIFVKAMGGLGTVLDGTLIDEDFPPGTVPYSKTTSDLDGDVQFFSIDAGYSFFEENGMRLGGFVGWGYWHEKFDAMGCRQIGLNPGICGVPIPAGVKVITEDNKYRSIRLGLAGDGRLSDKLSWNAEAAYLITDHDNVDTHYFTFGKAPANGDGDGFQLEAALLYQINPKFNVGIGGRWWILQTDVVIPSFGNQPESYDVDRTGVFVQGGMKLN